MKRSPKTFLKECIYESISVNKKRKKFQWMILKFHHMKNMINY